MTVARTIILEHVAIIHTLSYNIARQDLDVICGREGADTSILSLFYSESTVRDVPSPY